MLMDWQTWPMKYSTVPGTLTHAYQWITSCQLSLGPLKHKCIPLRLTFWLPPAYLGMMHSHVITALTALDSSCFPDVGVHSIVSSCRRGSAEMGNFYHNSNGIYQSIWISLFKYILSVGSQKWIFNADSKLPDSVCGSETWMKHVTSLTFQLLIPLSQNILF